MISSSYQFYRTYSLDIDECELSNGGCEHHCSNLIGSYGCSCDDGFVLNSDDRNCTGRYIHRVIQSMVDTTITCIQISTNVRPPMAGVTTSVPITVEATVAPVQKGTL